MEQIKCYCGHTTYCDCGPLEEPRKQTAVEWLVEQITDGTMPAREAIKQAKEMEKQQIIEAYCNGDDNISAQQYYNETHESNT